MAKIYVYQHGDITTTAIEGVADDISPVVRKYLKKQKLENYVDFSPILPQKDNRLFLVGNVYFPEVCTMITYQYTDGRQNNTSITAHGTSEAIALNMIKDFARISNFKTIEPSEQLRQEARLVHIPLEVLCKQAKASRFNHRQLFATALGDMQTKYKGELNEFSKK